MNVTLEQLYDYIFKKSGRIISAYAPSFLQKTIDQRIYESGSKNLNDYFVYICNEPNEVKKILSALNISYSLFFRNTMDFAILERFILPELFRTQEIKNDSIRIWSTGCAEGQEPYSIMMLADDLSKKQSKSNPVMLFATDISDTALKKAQEGVYSVATLQQVKLNYIDTYFTRQNQDYILCDIVKNNVMFSEYDLVNERTASPPFGIFGGYDVITCCNLMIYYKPEIQKRILLKLFSSLNNSGYLIVDNSERSIVQAFNGFTQYSSLGNIFVKRTK